MSLPGPLVADESRIRAAAAAHWRSARYRAWAAALVAVAGGLCFVPLADVLGLAFAFAVAIVAGVAACDLGAAYVRRARGMRARPADDATGPGLALWRLTGRAIALHLVLLAPPLVVIAANALRVRNCDWAFGAWAYLLLPGVTVVLCSALGVVLGVVCGDRRALSNAAPYLVFLGSAAIALWRFYAAPPVFVYTIFAGYFPGNLYDDELALSAPLLWSRAFQLAAVACAWAAAAALLDVPTLSLARSARRRPHGRRLAAWAAAATAGFLAVGAARSAGWLGFDVSADAIARHLGGRYDTEHFTIYYPPGGVIERDIRAIAEDHEFRYAQVARALGAEARGRITSFYFADADDKHRMMGARRVYMAKPWRREIYLNHSPTPHPILRHEIAHVVAGAFGDPVFHTSARTVLGLPVFFNVGMIEGIAVAADWPDHFVHPLTPHQSVKAMVELDLLPPVRRIFSTGFLAFSSARSYTLAGSFVRFLLDTRGAGKLRAAYASGGDLEAVYGQTEAALIAEWRALIEATPLPPRAAEIVRERFRRPGILERPCPHAIARLQALAAAAVARGDVDRAVELLRRVCDQARAEPSYRLDLARHLWIASRPAEAAAIYRDIAADRERISSTLRAEALIGLAAIAIHGGDRRDAIARLTEAAALPLGDDHARAAGARLAAAVHAGPAGTALRAYFWGHDPRVGADPMVRLAHAARAIAAEPDLGLGYYLLGYNLRGRGDPALTAWALGQGLDRGLPGPRFEREAARLLAEASYLAGDDAAVERAIDVLVRPDQPEVTRLYGLDFRERLHWRRTGELPPAP